MTLAGGAAVLQSCTGKLIKGLMEVARAFVGIDKMASLGRDSQKVRNVFAGGQGGMFVSWKGDETHKITSLGGL